MRRYVCAMSPPTSGNLAVLRHFNFWFAFLSNCINIVRKLMRGALYKTSTSIIRDKAHV